MQPTITITADMTLLEVTDRYPDTVEALAEAGFPRVRDPEKRKALGRSLTIGAAARLRKLDAGELVRRLRDVARAAHRGGDVTLHQGEQVVLCPPGDVRLSGLLPCPVRLPVLEAVQELAARLQDERGIALGYSLAAASVGAGGLTEQLTALSDPTGLPEVFVSAGFESFFDRRSLRRFKDAGTFVDVAPSGVNADFADLGVRDPAGHFTMLGVVPAVFLVNGPALCDDPPPRSWEDLLSGRFDGRVALPVSDFDLMNGMLLTLYRRMGEAGVRALSRSMVTALHPSQAAGRFAGRSGSTAAVSIVPYFFSRMTLGSQAIRVVWPEDGAIVCPIFMLVKAAAREAARPVSDLMLSRELGEVLAHRGLFPVLHPEVDNRLPEGAAFSWLGWEFIEQNDLGELIPRLNALFNKAGGEAQS